jgi:hypothetical protein
MMSTETIIIGNKLLIDEVNLKKMLIEAAQIGADTAIISLVSYNLKDAAKQIGITPKTLTKRILEGKIKSIDGRVSGLEIKRYLNS